jgi:hypothetical protein
MTAGVGFKFTVHFSTSFSTTRAAFRKMSLCSRADLATLGFAISLTTSASIALSDCFLVFFLPTVPMMSRVRINYRSIWIIYSASKRHSAIRSR